MFQTISTLARKRRSCLAWTAALSVVAAAPAVAQGGSHKDTAAPPPMRCPPTFCIFSAPLPDVPGKHLVVVALKNIPPKSGQPAAGHRHPGSVYVYVTEGTARFGIAGQPVREVRTGESFFEPPGALHTVMESASATDSASAIAVMIIPDGAPLVLPPDGAPAVVEGQKGKGTK